MKKFILPGLALLLIFLVNSCYYDNEELLYPKLQSGCDTTNITYGKTITGILSGYCYGCHGPTYQVSGNGIRLDTYSNVVNYLGRIIGSVNHTPGYSFMPKPSGKLDDCSIKQLIIWKNNGAPNN